MCLKDLSRSKSMVILIRRVLVGQNQIRMDLEEAEKKTGENENRLSLLKRFAVKEG